MGQVLDLILGQYWCLLNCTPAGWCHTDDQVQRPGISSLPQLWSVRTGQPEQGASEETARRSKAARSPAGNTGKVWKCHPSLFCQIRKGMEWILNKYVKQTLVLMGHFQWPKCVSGHHSWRAAQPSINTTICLMGTCYRQVCFYYKYIDKMCTNEHQCVSGNPAVVTEARFFAWPTLACMPKTYY